MTIIKPKDPLLNGARIVIVIFYAIFAAAMLGTAIGAIAIPSFGKAKVLEEFAKFAIPAEGIWYASAALLFICAFMFIAFRFMRELHGIINSVGEGDPFRPQNATRLNRMGWLAIAAQITILPVGAILGGWFHPYLEKAGKSAHFGIGIDISTILLILVLFILARVFRKGAAMQEELEGTV